MDPDQSTLFDPQAIIEMAFDPMAKLPPNASLFSSSGRPRKPHCTTPAVRCSAKSKMSATKYSTSTVANQRAD